MITNTPKKPNPPLSAKTQAVWNKARTGRPHGIIAPTIFKKRLTF